MVSDFEVVNHGSVCLLNATTDSALDWVAEHLPEDCPRFGGAYAIESRFVTDILNGILQDGLTIN